MDIKDAMARVVESLDLTTEEMMAVMRQIMTGAATDAQIAGFLVALRMKSETIDEITGAVQVMRELVTPVVVGGDYLVDIVGTGGDQSGLFNLSTATSFVVAAAGAKVVKHGNRSVSSKSGSTDLLEKAGIEIDLAPKQVARCVDEVGLGFMFAPAHHTAMKHAVGPRRELGVRTLFNILGPMTNPAGVRRQLIGVFNGRLARPMADVLKRLGSEHVLVVHSRDGLDEISIAAPTHVVELHDGKITEYDIQPEDYGLQSSSLIGLTVANADESLALIRDALGKRKGEHAEKAADMIALNAGAALYAAGVVRDIGSGVRLARDVIDTGQAAEKLHELAQFTYIMKHSDD